LSAVLLYPFRGNFLGDGRAFLDLLLRTKEHEPAAVRVCGENERVVARECAHDLRAYELLFAVGREREVRLPPPATAQIEREAVTGTAVR
jgi:hypothetical protein